MASIQVNNQQAWRLYNQGKEIVVSEDKYSILYVAKKTKEEVPQDYFYKEGLFYYLLLSQEESDQLSKMEKGIIPLMLLGMGLLLFSFNWFFILNLQNQISTLPIIVLMVLSYLGCHCTVKFYEKSKSVKDYWLSLYKKYDIED